MRALAKLEQVLPSRLRRRVSALGDATSAFDVDGPRIDADVLATLAGACRDGTRLRFSYVAKDDRATQRHVEPSAVVHSGYRWYLVAYDLDRDDWRTFRIDRLRGRVRLAERGRSRTVPGGDAAAFVKERLRTSTGDADRPPGTVRVQASAAEMSKRIPARYAVVEPEGEDTCIVTTRGAWTRQFLVWMAVLERPFAVLEPPEFRETGARLADTLRAATVER